MKSATKINEDTAMARGGKREGSGRKQGEPTKTVRIPEALIEAVEALVKLHKGTGTRIDYVTVDLAIARSAYCAERGIDPSNTAELRKAVKELKAMADESDDEALEEKAREWDRIATYGMGA